MHDEERAGVDDRDHGWALGGELDKTAAQDVAGAETAWFDIANEDVTCANGNPDLVAHACVVQRHFERGGPPGEPAFHRSSRVASLDDDGIEDILEPGEIGQDVLLWAIEDLVRRAAGDDASAIDHHRAIAERVDLAMAVRDIDHWNAPGVIGAAQVVHDARLDGVVERRERLVEQQQRRLGDERTGQRRTLTFAAGDIRRTAVEEIGDERPRRSSRHAVAVRPATRG